jgi:AraC family transcriptional regulator of adaptative response / DNA-3-methyladenine glycosylase II
MHLDRDACYRAVLTRDARFDGRFFTAVKTTRIYCRPICPARPPKLENVVFLPSAAAAHAAGFRPCLRCRPETSPQTGAWHGTCSTVSRGVALIASGALAEDDVSGLAGRLGIGERQLRRLFRKHLGASPKAVAQTRRVLLAKQLITDTSLAMTDIAEAAGFGSLRRYNDTFRKLYGRPPSTLRRSVLAGSPTGPSITVTLAYRPPHDFAALLGFLATRAIPGIEHVSSDGYARSITLDTAAGVIAGTIEIRPGVNALHATIRFPKISALPVIVERIRRIFDLGADPIVIAAHLSADPQLAPLVAARPGLRVPGAWDGFELAVRGILGQQISVAAATRLAAKLVASFGTRLPPDAAADHLTHVFPAPGMLADVDIAAALGMPRARGRAISAVAAAAAADRLLFAPCPDLALAVSRLKSLEGIGEWTAQYIAMRAMREPDAFPAADIGLLRALATPAGRPTPAELLARAEHWRPWRAYAALHLWSAGTP